jgi:hypothetical protein
MSTEALRAALDFSPLQSGLHGSQQHVWFEWLAKETDRARGYGLLLSKLIRVCGDENDRDARACSVQSALQFQPIHARHPDVQNQTRRLLNGARVQEESGRRIEGCDPVPDGSQKHPD